MNTIKLNKNKVSLKQCNAMIDILNEGVNQVKLTIERKDEKFNGFVVYELIKTKIETKEKKVMKVSTLKGIQFFLFKFFKSNK